jgi:hypothetical protein
VRAPRVGASLVAMQCLLLLPVAMMEGVLMHQVSRVVDQVARG